MYFSYIIQFLFLNLALNIVSLLSVIIFFSSSLIDNFQLVSFKLKHEKIDEIIKNYTVRNILKFEMQLYIKFYISWLLFVN